MVEWAAVGAFLSGAASVIGAVTVIHGLRRRMERECEQRIAMFREGIEEGRRPRQ